MEPEGCNVASLAHPRLTQRRKCTLLSSMGSICFAATVHALAGGHGAKGNQASGHHSQARDNLQEACLSNHHVQHSSHCNGARRRTCC